LEKEMSSRSESRLRNNNAVDDSQYAGFAAKCTYANVRINGKIAGKWMVDSGADVSVISNGLARSLGLSTSGGRINLSGLGGSQQSVPFVSISMQVENQPAFQTQLAIGNTNLNLLSHRDATKVFNISITSAGSTLQPKANVGAVEGDNILPPLEVETGAFSPQLLNTPVAAFVIFLAIAAVSE
jgi:hypothetical protein